MDNINTILISHSRAQNWGWLWREGWESARKEKLHSAINQQNATGLWGQGRENGNFEKGVLLTAFPWRPPRFLSHHWKDQAMWHNLFNLYNQTCTWAQLHVPKPFSSVHHAGSDTPWSTVILWSPSSRPG